MTAPRSDNLNIVFERYQDFNIFHKVSTKASLRARLKKKLSDFTQL